MPIVRGSNGKFVSSGSRAGSAFTAGRLLKGSVKRDALAGQL